MTARDDVTARQDPTATDSRGREFKDSIFTQFARSAAAFSSPRRVEIIDVLAQGERSVESIATESGLTMANTSRHLQVLKNAGLVASRKDRLNVIYRLADPSVLKGYQALRALSESRIGDVHKLAEAFFGEVDGAEAVSIDELRRRASAGEILLIDVRPELEFMAGHIAGAVSVPLAELSRQISELPRDRTVVAYCRGPYCVMAASAVRELRRAGLSAVRMDGGLPEWKAAELPVRVGA
ncbi:MAG: metalloregulator ArsR/SmtB family transcription factor [Candidatus Nanopelagicales bacterium]|nr:metalloregulator ArsR/SmtB family transcription factor [Candidatus Nanopelagicales bacterium]